MATQKITSFSKQTARTVADALIEAMQPVAASMGIVLEKHGGSIESDISTVFKFKGILAQKKAPSLEAAKQAEWNTRCLAYGLQPTHFGMKIDLPRSKAMTTLWEIRPRRSAKPIIVRAENGKMFALPIEYVLERIGAVKPAKQSKKSDKAKATDQDDAKKAFAKKMAAARAAKRAEREEEDESTNARKAVKRRQAAAKGGAAKAERTRQRRKVSSEKADEPKLTRAEKRAKAERAAKRAERKAKREAEARKAERSSKRNSRSTSKREEKPARAARGAGKRNVAKRATTAKSTGSAKRRNRMA